jgi:hypothetical protein
MALIIPPIATNPLLNLILSYIKYIKKILEI